MPHLVGIWSMERSEEEIRSCLAKQLQIVRIPRAAGTDHCAVYPGFGMAFQDPGILQNGPQPASTEDGRYRLLLDGEIWNAEELALQFRQDLPQGTCRPPELCLRLLLRHGTTVLGLLNGIFCIVLYDARNRTVTICSDRYGFRSVYYVQRSNTLLFATEIKGLTAVDPGPKAWDGIGILEGYCYGTQFMERTWMEGYRRLPPASIMTMEGGRLSVSSYWSYKYDEACKTLDQPTYFTTYGKLLDRAVERCLRGGRRVGIFLSGGYDSRAVAACIQRHHLPLPAFTFGHSSSRDVRFASMLAKALGLEHHAFTDPGLYLVANCPSIVWRTEGLSSFADTTSMHHHAILKKHADIILTGFLAEFGGSHTWPQLLMARSRTAAIRAIFDRYVAPRLAAARRIFTASFLTSTEAAVRGRFHASFEKIANDHPLNIADSWNFTHLQPCSTFHSTSVDRHLFEVRAPHMDWDLVQFLLTIPPYARLEQRVYKKMIAYAFPAIRQVPCTNSGAPINPSFLREYPGMTFRYLGRKVLDHVPAALRPRPALGREFRSLADDFRSEPDLVSRLLHPLLRQGFLPSEIFDANAIERIVSEHYQNRQSHEAAIGRLISWGLAAKYFLHDDLSDPPDILQAEGQ